MYLDILNKWADSISPAVFTPGGSGDVACIGLGDHGHWTIQTNATYFAALATLSEYNKSADRELAIKVLRFLLRSHISGPETCFDGVSWGHSWISILGIQRCLHAIEIIEKDLTDEDRELFDNLLISEADDIYKNYLMEADIDAASRKNKPESNIWNAALLCQCANFFPDNPAASSWRDKATEGFINGISVPKDALDKSLYNGKKVRDWHNGANYTGSYGLNHHGYLNVGYMMICVSNIAMLHFSFKKRGLQVPDEAYFHLRDLWDVLSKFVLDDGRLWRIGGDTRVRYCYCQDYIVPALMLMHDKYGMDYSDNLGEWLRIVRKEQDLNSNGAFFTDRLEGLKAISPPYYYRLEGDRAAAISMGLRWSKLYNGFQDRTIKDSKPVSTGSWSDDYHGAFMLRTASRHCSWVWKGAGGPMGFCIPANSSDMLEWQHNLCGKIYGIGKVNKCTAGDITMAGFKGGFATSARLVWHSSEYACEGQAAEDVAEQYVAAVALDDDASLIVFQQAKTMQRVYLSEVKGIMLNVPNDVFNDFRRLYNGQTVKGLGCAPESHDISEKSIVIDEKLELRLIESRDKLSILSPGHRQINIINRNAEDSEGNLYCDEICAPCQDSMAVYPARHLLFENIFSLSTEQFGELAVKSLNTGSDHVKAVKVSDRFNQESIILFNSSSKPAVADVMCECNVVTNLLTRETVKEADKMRTDLAPLEIKVFRFKAN